MSKDSQSIPARHVFCAPISGDDRIAAWQAATAEPLFVWGDQNFRPKCYGSLKRRFTNWLASCPEAHITIYHDSFGPDLLSPLDPAPQKVLFPHSWPPRWQAAFGWQLRTTGKVWVGTEAEKSALQATLAWIPERFIAVVPQPLLPCDPHVPASAVRPEGESPLRCGIWLQGRSWKPDGNRLRALMDRWSPDLGPLEIICDGQGPPKWGRQPHLIWYFNTDLASARRHAAHWESVLLLQDFSLSQPWLFECLQHGCFPLVPDGDHPCHDGIWGEPDAPNPYPWGDMDAAIQRLKQWRRANTLARLAFRGWAHATALPHQSDAFQSAYTATKATFASQRPIQLRRRSAPSALAPLFWFRWVHRIRAG